ncbi:GIY-YIG nuclease family protein [Dyadobacter chenhuakuii]|uniref:GIY-YIG nuclease family protein n=1 Tax=Dyadobacter chenhuakuii TaxID=2909339 RepID=A0ABY4XJ14_9BACT|nr:GIY-YIG nuclease family protein [Dyadobacter chenhuakuii]MCF2496131.1 GIY-YIG nuclease family protein [Dyadobacter chenhuakuii]USJ30195.1 GIY-YIG nuclease family protein [Dyadobacter chenhuakuii]
MSFVVYVLFSDSLGKFYVGQTQDLDSRLRRHNEGRVNFTAKGIPWKLVHTFECADRSTAVQLESKIKKRGIKRHLQDLGLQ